MKVSVFGNSLVEKDSLPLKILPELKKRFPDIKFVVEDPTETLNPPPGEWVILDSAQGIDDVVEIHDLEKIENSNQVSVHDYDLSFELKLLKKLGKISKIKIVAIPIGMKKKEAIEKVSEMLRSNLSLKSGWSS